MCGKRRQAVREFRQFGFTYPLLLILIVILALGSVMTSRVSSQLIKKSREQELIFRGQAVQAAIKSYYESGATKVYPRSIKDLLKDPRFPHKIHLRRAYPDPFSSQLDSFESSWRMITSAEGGITGVASRSAQATIQKAHLPYGIEVVDEGNTYQEWLFVHIPKQADLSLYPDRITQ